MISTLKKFYDGYLDLRVFPQNQKVVLVVALVFTLILSFLNGVVTLCCYGFAGWDSQLTFLGLSVGAFVFGLVALSLVFWGQKIHPKMTLGLPTIMAMVFYQIITAYIVSDYGLENTYVMVSVILFGLMIFLTRPIDHLFWSLAYLGIGLILNNGQIGWEGAFLAAAMVCMITAVFNSSIRRGYLRELQLQDQLKAANRALNSKNFMLNTIASTFNHDGSSKISAIEQALKFIGNPNVNADRRTTNLGIVSASISQLRVMFRLANLMSKIGLGIYKPELNKLNPMNKLDEMLTLLNTKIESSKKAISLTYEIDPGLNANYLLAEVVLQTIWDNFPANAVKHTHSQIKIKVWLEDGQLKTSVSDNGRGIPAHEHELIFQSGYKAAGNNEKGDGLGLGFTKMVTEAAGGKIWLESEEGKGAIFYASLPVELAPNVLAQDEEYDY